MKYSNIFRDKEDINSIRKATEISTSILRELSNNVKFGISAKDIDDLAEKLCKENDVKPSFKGVKGTKIDFPSNVCVSINDEVIHAIPAKEKIFKEGDIIKIDFGIIYKGFFTDHCVTVSIGEIALREKALINTARLCIETAVKEAYVGNTIGDISFAMQTVAELAGFNYVTSYCGHGIGKSLHLSPEILSYGKRGNGPKLEKGMLLCIENQLTMGSGNLKLSADGWSLKTVDGSKSAMFEHMVLVDKAPILLTRL